MTLKPGTYTYNFFIEKRLNIRSQSFENQALIKSGGDRCMTIRYLGPDQDPSGTEVLNVIFDGTNTTYDAVSVDNFEDSTTWLTGVTFTGCTIQNSIGESNGLIARGAVKGFTFQDGVVDNCGGHNLYLQGPESAVLRSTIKNGVQWGVHMFSSPPAGFEGVQPNKCRIEDCDIYDNGHPEPKDRGFGSVIAGGANHTVKNNRYFGNYEGGIEFIRALAVTCTGNQLFAAGVRSSDSVSHATNRVITEIGKVTYLAKSNTLSDLSRPAGF